MTLHLDKHVFLVRVDTHISQLSYCRDLVLGILKLCCDPQCCTSNKLIMLLEDDASGHIAVDEVESEMQGSRRHAELRMDFDHEVDEERKHIPLQLGLKVHH